MSTSKIAVVMSGFPRRSETFANNELLALAKRGALAAIFAIKAGDGAKNQPGVDRLLEFIHLVPEGNHPNKQLSLQPT